MNSIKYITKVISPAMPWTCKTILSKIAGFTVIITEDNSQSFRLREQLLMMLESQEVLVLPDFDVDPYTFHSNKSESYYDRIHSIYELVTGDTKQILITPVSNLFYKLPPKDYLNKSYINLKVGDTFSPEKVYEFLSISGYAQTAQTRSLGEFSMRGSIIDVFTPGIENPIRVNFNENTLERISAFDENTQLTFNAIETAKVLPIAYFDTSDLTISTFKENYRKYIKESIYDSVVYQKISNKFIPAGIEDFTPLFFKETSLLNELIPSVYTLVSTSDLSTLFTNFKNKIFNNYRSCNKDQYLNPSQLYNLNTNEILLDHAKQVYIINPKTNDELTEPSHNVGYSSIETIYNGNDWFSSILDYGKKDNFKIIFCSNSEGSLSIVSDLLKDRSIDSMRLKSLFNIRSTNSSHYTIKGSIYESVIIKNERIILIDTELFLGKQKTTTRNKKPHFDRILESLEHLHIGEPIIHKRFGLGKYQGLKILEGSNYSNEFMVIEYADKDLLYVPIYDLNLVSKYSSSKSDLLKLHKLGSNQWDKVRKKSIQNIRDVAVELLNIYAHRNAQVNKKNSYDSDEYKKFCDEFPYSETPDQLKAFQTIEEEFKSGKLIDRLICGDVGFGKTEIALRATYMHLLAGYKVVVLVPTTLLAQQHFDNFTERFKNHAINIEIISRMQSAKTMETINKQILDGKIDLIIATHKILNNKQLFKHFKLIIVDEEHRFGVRQKEILTSMRADQNLVSLTATPIPRTLNLTLNGIRDISIISTPPPNKKNVFTQHIEWNKEFITEACQRELKRGGQVYFVHNRVQSLEEVKTKLMDILPNTNISVAHGQMPTKDLTKVVKNFNNKHTDILLCTSIIESGIDNHNVNTIFINDADRLGLSQIHQLRGRVGRGSEHAYAYIITKPVTQLTVGAKKRIEAIELMSDLGSGFLLAAQDLEIRGAGELLGAKQSGDIQEIGFNYYNELLSNAIDSLKSGKDIDLSIDLDQGIEINLGITALIPEYYIPDINLRLNYYKRIATEGNHRSIKIELIDLFGLIPDEVERLIALSELKKLMRLKGIAKINGSMSKFKISLLPYNNINMEVVMRLIREGSNEFYLKAQREYDMNITIIKPMPAIDDILRIIHAITS
jgi:transcription-repair coupling factor (superfamily II helicase)